MPKKWSFWTPRQASQAGGPAKGLGIPRESTLKASVIGLQAFHRTGGNRLHSCNSVSSVQSVTSNSTTHGLQHARPPCPSATPGVYSNSCPLTWWCHLTISSSVIPFSSHLPSFPESGFFPMSQFFASDGQRIGASASAPGLPMNNQDWFRIDWLDLFAV